MLSLTRNEQDQPEPLKLEIPMGWPKPEKTSLKKTNLLSKDFNLEKNYFTMQG